MSRIATISVAFFLTGLILQGCGSGDQKEEEGKAKEKEKVEKTSPSEEKAMPDTARKAYYQVPTPNQMFEIIQELGGEPESGLLHETEKVDDYVGTRKKAINFGVYSTDLAYTSIFDMGSKALKYFSTVEKLGEDLGISSVIDKETVENLKKNIDKSDTLANISKETYFRAYQRLGANDREDVLAMIVAGGWVEGLYLTTHMVDSFDKGDPIVRRIVDQRFTLDNILKFMEQHQDKSGVARTMKELKGIEAVYEGFKKVEEEAAELKEKDGKHVLGGGSKVTVNQEQFDSLVKEVRSVRKTFTGK